MKTYVNTKIIENYMKENKLTKTKFCKTCKISVATLNKIFDGKNVRVIAFFRIAKTMNIEICKLFEK